VRCVNSCRLFQEFRCPIFRRWVAHDVLGSSDPKDGCSQLHRNLGNFTSRRGVTSRKIRIFNTLLLRIPKIAADWTGFFTQSVLSFESLYGNEKRHARASSGIGTHSPTARGCWDSRMYTRGNTHSCSQYEVNVASF
jgi:hypothetical protein